MCISLSSSSSLLIPMFYTMNRSRYENSLLEKGKYTRLSIKDTKYTMNRGCWKHIVKINGMDNICCVYTVVSGVCVFAISSVTKILYIRYAPRVSYMNWWRKISWLRRLVSVYIWKFEFKTFPWSWVPDTHIIQIRDIWKMTNVNSAVIWVLCDIPCQGCPSKMGDEIYLLIYKFNVNDF